jgi:hypothetical protein
MSDTYALSREIENAKILREQIIAAAGDDPDFIRDGIEGETNLFEMIDRMVADDGEDEVLIEGLKEYELKIRSRRERIQQRKEVRRALLGTALDLAGVKKRECPGGTLSLRNVPPSVIVQEEADIPAQFFKPQPPKLDKKALLDFMKNGNTVKGATLSNGSVTTSIKR